MNPPEKKLEKRTSVQYAGMPVQQKCLNIDLLQSQSSFYYQLVCYFLIGWKKSRWSKFLLHWNSGKRLYESIIVEKLDDLGLILMNL